MCLVAQFYLTFCDHMDCSPPGSSVHGDSPGKNPGVGGHALLQGILPTQGSKHASCIAGGVFTTWATREVILAIHNHHLREECWTFPVTQKPSRVLQVSFSYPPEITVFFRRCLCLVLYSWKKNAQVSRVWLVFFNGCLESFHICNYLYFTPCYCWIVSWPKTQHSENSDHGIRFHHLMANRWGNNGNSKRLNFPGFQNHCRWWLQPWN